MGHSQGHSSATFRGGSPISFNSALSSAQPPFVHPRDTYMSIRVPLQPPLAVPLIGAL